jgi:hypothetical protein
MSIFMSARGATTVGNDVAGATIAREGDGRVKDQRGREDGEDPLSHVSTHFPYKPQRRCWRAARD